MKARYYLKAFWQKRFTRVTKEQYITAQKKVGAFDGEGGTTTFFEGHGILGKATIVDEKNSALGRVSSEDTCSTPYI